MTSVAVSFLTLLSFAEPDEVCLLPHRDGPAS